MSDIAEIDQTEFDNVPASVPFTMHDSNDALTEPIADRVADVVEPIVDAVEKTVDEIEESAVVETVDVTEPMDDEVFHVTSSHIAEEPIIERATESAEQEIEQVVHAPDSQEALNAHQLAEEEAEDKLDEIEEINTELAAAAAMDRKKRQQEELLAAIQQALAGTSGQSMEMFGLGGDEYDDYEDDEQNESDVPADSSMFAWLKSNLLPAAPISSYFTSRSLQRYGRLYSLKAGRLAWNIGTASLLLLVPYIIAHANELAFVDSFRETNRLQELLNDAHSKGYEGHASAPLGAAGQPQMQQAHVASKAPPGYVPPPVSVAAIPQQ